jgi:TonB family protein
MTTSEGLKMPWWAVVALVGLAARPLVAGQDGAIGPVNKGGGDSVPPQVIFAPDPSYTLEARQKKISGEVSLRIDVLTDGTTNNIRVLKSLDPGLDQSAVETITHWRFRPATKSGTPVTTDAVVVVRFRLPYVNGPGIYSGLPCAASINTTDIKGLLKKANKGDAQSQLMMGCVSEYGLDMPTPDRELAIQWYRKAAESLIPAQYFLGDAYLSNFDYVHAYTWLRIADLGGYKDPKEELKIVTQLLSTEQLRTAEEQVAAWKLQHRTN